MRERKLLIIKLIASHILPLPVLIAAALMMKSERWIMVSISQTVLFILYLSGYWEFFTLGFKKTFLAFMQSVILIVVSVSWSAIRIGKSSPVWLALLMLVQIILFYEFIKIILVIMEGDKKAMKIEFPFQKGKFLITDGGNSKVSRLMNYHFHSAVHKKKKTNRSMLYATDIVRLDGRKTGFLPLRNEDYPVWHEEVCSPMEGTVIRVINDIEDNRPFSGNYPYNTGNTVVIRNGDYFLLMGHLKKGSIRVQQGERVDKMKVIGEAGNSGMSERPHLHMQLMKCETEDYWTGLGISMVFKGWPLYKNRVIRMNC